MSKVTFLSIGVQNLGPFRERQLMDLSARSTRPVVLVQALNGSGKTTLLTCLQIALYGSKALGASRSSEYEQMIRGLQRADASGNSRVDLSLRIELNGERDDIQVSREWTVTPARVVERLTISRGGSVDFQMGQEWDEYLDSILPCELLQLFLFDGEKIEALANPRTLPDMLRRATEAFLGIGGIDQLGKDLVAVERRALIQAKHESEEYTSARAELEDMEAALAQTRERIGILSQAEAGTLQLLELNQKAYERYASEAQRSGLAAYEKAAEIRAAELAARKRVAEAEDKVRAALSDPLLPLAGLGALWTEYKSTWAQESETRASRHLLNEILARDQRVLQGLRGKIEAKAVESVQEVLGADVRRYADKASLPMHLVSATPPVDLESLIADAKSAHQDAVSRLEAARAELSNLERQVAAIPQGDRLSEMLAELKSKSAAVTEAEVRLAAVRQELADHRSNDEHVRVRVEAARQRMAKDFQGHALESKALAAGQRARAVLATYKERLLASKAAWLSEMITTEFKALMRKQRLVIRVHVDPDSYEVHIIGAHGHELPMERLSAGERQLLAIAVLTALIRKRRGRFPVVVDTPLARLDRTHRAALVKHFFAKVSHQVMVLSTDEEVEGNVLAEMERHTSRSYVIQFSDEERRSVFHAQDLAREYVQP